MYSIVLAIGLGVLRALFLSLLELEISEKLSGQRFSYVSLVSDLLELCKSFVDKVWHDH